MRKITEEASKAFMNGQTYKNNNTEVKQVNGESELYLHGHLIARGTSGKIYISNCAYYTLTTKERLNGLLYGAYTIKQIKGNWFLTDIGGSKIDFEVFNYFGNEIYI